MRGEFEKVANETSLVKLIENFEWDTRIKMLECTFYKL